MIFFNFSNSWYFLLANSVRRLRREKGTFEEVNVVNDAPATSYLGKRAHESSQSESENEPENETEHCSRTL